MEKALWSRLEGKVRQAATTLEALRKENQELRDKLAGLQEKDQDREAWKKEKVEARERAEGLIQLLEDLLEGDSQEG